MIVRRPRAPGGSRGLGVPFLLSLVSAGATAGFAGYYLGAAWRGVVDCPTAGAPGCATYPFWGFSPGLYLAACLIGVGGGAAIAVVGALAFLGRLGTQRAGYALVGLSAIAVIAYGGLGLGTVAGIVSGGLVLQARTPRASAPTEWSGSLPTGVPPVPPGSKRPVTSRPPVTEWRGIFATAPQGPPSRGRNRVTLPSADRLALTLQRNRAAPASPAEAGDAPPPVVVLPPPPVGLRSVMPDAPRVAPAVPARAAPPAGRGPLGTPPPAAPGVPLFPRGSGPSRRPGGEGPAPVAPLRTADGPIVTPSLVLGAPPDLPHPRGVSPPTTGPVPGAAGTIPPGPPGRPVASGLRAPPAGTTARTARPTDRPPQPTGPLPKSRTKAWKCPRCGIVNAPWSPRCTTCRSTAPREG